MERKTWRKGKKEKTRKEKEREKDPGSHGGYIKELVEISDVYIEHVCFSVSTCDDCVIFSCCEWIDAVHANPAGEMHSCKLKTFFSPRCFCAVQSYSICAHDSEDNTAWVMNVCLLTAYFCIKTLSTLPDL